MSRSVRLALLIGGLGGCTGSTILLGNPPTDGGASDAGPVPTVELLPNPLDFGGISAGAGKSLPITLLNAGSMAAFVIFDPPAPAPPFSLSSPGKVTTHLAVAQLLDGTIGVTFAPTTTGPRLGHLNYIVCPQSDPDAGGCSPTQSLTLQGNGL